MVHVVFDTATVGYDDFMVQTGSGIGEIGDQVTEGNHASMQFFRGSSPYQRGYGVQDGSGIGDVFRGLLRIFLPIIRKVGTTVSAEALQTGQRVLDRFNEGQPLKDAFITEGKKGMDTILEKGGLPKQFGSGSIKMKKGRRKAIILPSHHTLINHPVIKKPIRKRLRKDAFGLF